MFRFTIRDVLWLTVVVGMGVALGIERNRANGLRAELSDALRRIQATDLQLVELARIWKAHSPEKVEIEQDWVVAKSIYGTEVHLNRHPK